MHELIKWCDFYTRPVHQWSEHESSHSDHINTGTAEPAVQEHVPNNPF